MTDAKIPGNHRDAIDIFLFSNGQQYTPPRKYHLLGEELNWWDTILDYLAKSQFGSTHSHIHLYTLQGRRVDDPVELTSGTAYVAVGTSDVFIDSGYDKYLIKATRSWEKRQSRKSDNGEIRTDESFDVIANSDDIKSIKPPDESYTTESVINQAYINALAKPRASIPTRKSSIFSSKPADRKSLSTSHHPALKKSGNQTLQTPLKRISLKTKETPQKKIVKPPFRNFTAISNATNDKAKIINTTIKLKDTLTKSPRPSKGEEIKTTSVTRISNKSLLTESATMGNVIGDKDIVVVSNINNSSEINSKVLKIDDNSIQREHNDAEQVAVLIPIDEEVQTVTYQTVNDDNQGISYQKTTNTSSKTSLHNTQRTTMTDMVVSNHLHNPVQDNYVTVMNKGDVVSLKLMIEIKNEDNKKTIYRTVRKTHSLTNIFKLEKGSQVNTEDEILIRSQTLQSVINNEILQSTHRESDHKIVVIQCNCDEDATNHKNKTQVNPLSSKNGNNKYVILMPRWEKSSGTKLNEDIDKSPLKMSYKEVSVEKMTDLNGEHRQNSIKSIKEYNLTTPMGATSIKTNSIVNEDDGNEFTVIKRKVTVTDEALPELNRQIGTKTVVSHENGVEYNVGHVMNEVITKSDDISYEAVPNAAHNIITKQSSKTRVQQTEHRVVEDSSWDMRNRENKWTQMDISDMLLEARIHEDGRYTFHLPPLQVLKYYGVIQ